MTEPKWLQIARDDIGIKEIAGPSANPAIMDYYRAANANWAKDDAVPWCGAAMAAWVSRAGHPVPPTAARARAWLDWGTVLEQPKPGAVTVFARGADPASGHVCLYLEDRGDRVLVLGGNQGDAVSITSYPKRDLLGYRWPAGADIPVAENRPPLTSSTTIRNAVTGLAATGAVAAEHGAGAVSETIGAVRDAWGPGTTIGTLAEAAKGDAKWLLIFVLVAVLGGVIISRVRAQKEGKIG